MSQIELQHSVEQFLFFEAALMDNRDYDQIEIPSAVLGDSMQWVLPNSEVEVLFEPADSGTRVTVQHRGWSALRAGHPLGRLLPGSVPLPGRKKEFGGSGNRPEERETVSPRELCP